MVAAQNGLPTKSKARDLSKKSKARDLPTKNQSERLTKSIREPIAEAGSCGSALLRYCFTGPNDQDACFKSNKKIKNKNFRVVIPACTNNRVSTNTATPSKKKKIVQSEQGEDLASLTKHTSRNPGIAPNKAPDRILRNTGPGIANDCKNMYK